MYGDKEGVAVFKGKNPKCYFDVKVSYSTEMKVCVCA